MKRSTLLILAGAALAIGGGLVVARMAAPGYVRERLVSEVHEACPSCKLELGDVDLGLLRGNVELNDVRYEGPLGNGTRMRVKAERVAVRGLSWTSLGSRPSLREVRVDTPVIVVNERESPPAPESPASPLPELRVGKIEIRNGHFKYRAVHPKGDGEIEFRRIDVDAGEWNSIRGGGLPPFEVLLNAHGPRGGDVRIEAKFQLAEKSREKAHEITLRLHDYDLTQANAFFLPTAAVKLKGHIDDARSETRFLGPDLTGWVMVAYHGLKLDFVPDVGKEDKSPISTFISDFFSKLKVKESQPHDGLPVPQIPVKAKWDGHKGLPGFVLGGIGKAAMELMQR